MPRSLFSTSQCSCITGFRTILASPEPCSVFNIVVSLVPSCGTASNSSERSRTSRACCKSLSWFLYVLLSYTRVWIVLTSLRYTRFPFTSFVHDYTILKLSRQEDARRPHQPFRCLLSVMSQNRVRSNWGTLQPSHVFVLDSCSGRVPSACARAPPR